MASSLFPNQQNNPFQIMSEFKKFLSSGITPEKAQQIINEKLQNGELSEDRLNELKNQAQQMLKLFR
mgnify:CR=1 FL=1